LGDLPCFWGFDDSYGYETWMDDLERLFSYYDMADMQMYLYVKCRLKGEIKHWWWKNHFHIRSWTHMEVFLRDRYSCHPMISHSSRRYCDHSLQLWSPQQPRRPRQLSYLLQHNRQLLLIEYMREICETMLEQMLDLEQVMFEHRSNPKLAMPEQKSKTKPAMLDPKSNLKQVMLKQKS